MSDMMMKVEVPMTAEEAIRFQERARVEKRPVSQVIRDCALAGLNQPIAKKGED